MLSVVPGWVLGSGLVLGLGLLELDLGLGSPGLGSPGLGLPGVG